MVSLRLEVHPPQVQADDNDEAIMEFAQIGTICAIPADKKSSETVYFVKIVDHHANNTKDQTLTDDWDQTISPGQSLLEGRYYLHQYSRKNEAVYALDKRRVYFFKECIVYPFVQHECVKDGITVSNTEQCDIINFVQTTGMSSL